MPGSDIYVQVTASSAASAKSRSVVVFVPRKNIDTAKEQKGASHSDDTAIAKSLAEPLVTYAFNHRQIFPGYTLSCSFYLNAPAEIHGKSPNLSQAGLKAWITS
jgi:hypothetical protein